jgi:hypothetical protein
MNSEYSNLPEREQQNKESSNYIFNNYRDQCNDDISVGRTNGYIPPCLIGADSELRQSISRKVSYQPDTSSIRTDCYNINGSMKTSCDLPMSDIADNYLRPSTSNIECDFNKILSTSCAPSFLQSTTVASKPQLLEHIIQPYVRGGMNSRHLGRTTDEQNKDGNNREIIFRH